MNPITDANMKAAGLMLNSSMYLVRDMPGEEITKVYANVVASMLAFALGNMPQEIADAMSADLTAALATAPEGLQDILKGQHGA